MSEKTKVHQVIFSINPVWYLGRFSSFSKLLSHLLWLVSLQDAADRVVEPSISWEPEGPVICQGTARHFSYSLRPKFTVKPNIPFRFDTKPYQIWTERIPILSYLYHHFLSDHSIQVNRPIVCSEPFGSEKQNKSIFISYEKTLVWRFWFASLHVGYKNQNIFFLQKYRVRNPWNWIHNCFLFYHYIINPRNKKICLNLKNKVLQKA